VDKVKKYTVEVELAGARLGNIGLGEYRVGSRRNPPGGTVSLILVVVSGGVFKSTGSRKRSTPKEKSIARWEQLRKKMHWI